jgi:geranylgeranyl diphosphate synthase type II
MKKITTPDTVSNDFHHYLQACQHRVNQALERCLPPATAPAERLKSAMRYSVQNGGKRVRATLVYAGAEAIGCCSEENCPNRAALDVAACAVELIHAYSLIHDDLPAMDDDGLRRGLPTCHIAYDEATAILAGDALQTLAFEILSLSSLPAEIRLALITTLSAAAGHAGMVGGQVLDMEGEDRSASPLTLQELEQIHRHKTGALICASVKMGALIAKASEAQLIKLEKYALATGLAFQVIDDILDVEGSTEALGKTSGADQMLNKSTYPALLGLKGAKQKAAELHQEALNALEAMDKADRLRQLSAFIVERQG